MPKWLAWSHSAVNAKALHAYPEVLLLRMLKVRASRSVDKISTFRKEKKVQHEVMGTAQGRNPDVVVGGGARCPGSFPAVEATAPAGAGSRRGWWRASRAPLLRQRSGADSGVDQYSI